MVAPFTMAVRSWQQKSRNKFRTTKQGLVWAVRKLIETNSSKYAIEDATPQNNVLQDKLVRVVLDLHAIKNHEVGPVFPFRSVGRELR